MVSISHFRHNLTHPKIIDFFFLVLIIQFFSTFLVYRKKNIKKVFTKLVDSFGSVNNTFDQYILASKIIQINSKLIFFGK